MKVPDAGSAYEVGINHTFSSMAELRARSGSADQVKEVDCI